jgi:hypothetical protein
MNLFDPLIIAIYHQLPPWLGHTSKAVPPCVKRSSSPSSLARSTTSSAAPWNIAQGVRRTFASGNVRSDHPPGPSALVHLVSRLADVVLE